MREVAYKRSTNSCSLYDWKALFGELLLPPPLQAGSRLATLAGEPVTVRRDLAAGEDGLPPTDALLFATDSGTRVLVRHAAVACYRDRDVPASYVELLEQVARAADIVGL